MLELRQFLTGVSNHWFLINGMKDKNVIVIKLKFMTCIFVIFPTPFPFLPLITLFLLKDIVLESPKEYTITGVV